MDLRILHVMFIRITGCWAQDLVVSQPKMIKAAEGESVLLRCSYNTTSQPEVGSYQWVKEPGQVAVRNTTQEFLGRVMAVKDQDFLRDRKADIEIKDLRQYDSGVYRCVVNLHGFQETSGKGTQLCVVKPRARTSGVAPPEDYMVFMWILLRGFLCAFGITAVALGTHLYYGETTWNDLLHCHHTLLSSCLPAQQDLFPHPSWTAQSEPIASPQNIHKKPLYPRVSEFRSGSRK